MLQIKINRLKITVVSSAFRSEYQNAVIWIHYS